MPSGIAKQLANSDFECIPGHCPMTTGSITNWLDLFRSGDEDAATRLWERYFSRLVGIARSKMIGMPNQAEDAEDVALSAFHTLYQAARGNRLPDLTDREGLWESLLVITAGKIIDARRRDSCQKRGGSENGSLASAPAFNSNAAVLEAALSDEEDPAIAAMVNEEFSLLMERLEDGELQEIAILKLEAYTNAEIADRLNCSERTVKRRLTVIRRIWAEACLNNSHSM